MKFLKGLFCLLLLFIATRLNAQVDTTWTPSKTYSQNQLMADFDLFKRVLTEAHPSLYRYKSKAAIDSAFEKAAGKINKPMTGDEFWHVLEPVVVSIHSGHTDLFPSSAEVWWYNKHPANFLPGVFFVADDSLFMISRKKGDSVKKIRPVLSIDSIPADKLIDTLREYISGEGLSTQFVNFKLQGNIFSRIYGQVYGYKPTYAVVITDSINRPKTITMKARTAPYGKGADKSKEALENKKDQLSEVVSVRYPPDAPATAVLKIKNFTYVNYYLSFHQQFFKLMYKDKVKNLVIDLRGNTGGFPAIGLDLMRYLVNGRCTQIKSRQEPYNKISFNNNILKGAGYDANVDTTGEHENYKYHLKYFSDVYCYTDYFFDKNVYLLVDKGTFSAASIFAASLKNQRKIIVLGEETGGSETGSDSAFSIIKLPNTGLLLDFPRYWVNIATDHPKSTHGLIPDVVVKSSPVTSNGEDAVMVKVKALILSEK